MKYIKIFGEIYFFFNSVKFIKKLMEFIKEFKWNLSKKKN